MAAKQRLQNSIRQLLRQHKQDSYATQSKRKNELLQMADDLVKSGYKLKHISGIKQKHLLVLNQLWKERGLSAGTIKNKNAQLRWVCSILGKANMMPSNDALGVQKRQYVGNTNKAIELDSIDLNKTDCPYMKIYLSLQYHLGLRREEALKLKPYLADKGHYLQLQGSWCKGGRSRIVPIVTQEARDALDAAKQLVSDPTHSLIPEERSYKEQKTHYDTQVKKLGIKHAHGLRHAYAQNRYKALSGLDCPFRGGLSRKQMNSDQRFADRQARMLLSEELGHSRLQITKNYLG